MFFKAPLFSGRSILYSGESNCRKELSKVIEKGFRPYSVLCDNDRAIWKNRGNNKDNIFESWVLQLKELDYSLIQAYSRRGVISITPDTLKNIEHLIDRYNFLVSLFLKENWPNSGRVTNKNLPKNIERVQRLFIESFSILIFCVFEIKKSKENNISGIDGVSFKLSSEEKKKKQIELIKKTRFYKSSKKISVKKDFPLKGRLSDSLVKTINKNVNKYNNKLAEKLINTCRLKTFRKNYVGSSIKRIWIAKSEPNQWRPIGISTLKERVLQTIIYKAVHPIVEYQADPYSFGSRLKRSGLDAISLITNRLTYLGLNNSKSDILPSKVSFKIFQKSKDLKMKTRSRMQDTFAKKRRRVYDYNYWILKRKNSIVNKSNSNKKIFTYFKFINVVIKKCFDNISFTSILEKYPLCNKYKFLLNAWLHASVIGSPTAESTIHEKFQPKSGIPQSSIIGPQVINCILDGLENFCLEGLPKSYKLSNSQKLKALKLGIPVPHSQKRKIMIIRYVDDILILGKSDLAHFRLILDRLKSYLDNKGLSLKNENRVDVQEFSPGKSLEYLGFKFLYKNYKNPKFALSKFTKIQPDPFVILKNNFSNFSRSGLLVLIRQKSFKKAIFKIKTILSRKNTPLPVKLLIERVNAMLRGTVNYYGHFQSTRVQLKQLDHLIYKKFWMLLQNKYQSKRKLRTFLRKKFYKKGSRLHSENSDLLRTIDILRFGGVPFHRLAKNREFWESNIYLDSKVMDSVLKEKTILTIKTKYLKRHALTPLEYKILLLYSQKDKCPICLKPIDITLINKSIFVEVDHNPRVHDLKKNIWEKLSSKYGFCDGSKKITPELLVSESFTFDLNNFFDKELENVFVRLVHKNCNTKDAAIARKESAQQRKYIESKLNKLTLDYFKTFLKKTNTLIRARTLFSKYQYSLIFKK